MKKNKPLTSSLKNYLMAIHNIVEEKKAARVKDISKYLSVGASSVSEALKILAEKGLINYEAYGIATLTDEGEEIAQDILNRHGVIKNFFENVLSTPSNTAEQDAEQLKYCISEESLGKFIMFLKFMQTCSCKNPKWILSYKEYSKAGELAKKCKKCIDDSIKNPNKNNNNCCGLKD